MGHAHFLDRHVVFTEKGYFGTKTSLILFAVVKTIKDKVLQVFMAKIHNKETRIQSLFSASANV